MPPAKKDCQVILYDVNTKNPELSKQCLLKFCFKKLFTGSKDLFKLILMNTKTTKNRLNSRHGGYENIHEVMAEPTVHNPGLVVGAIESAEIGQANWLESLEVAAKTIQDDLSLIAGAVTLQLIFITDLSNCKPSPSKNIEQIIDMLRPENIYLYIIGLDVEVPKTIENLDDIPKWMDNLEVNQSNPDLKTVKAIISELNNRVVCDYKIGSNLILNYKNWQGRQAWNVPLTVGSLISFPAQTRRIIETGLECKLKSNARESSQVKFVDAEDASFEIPYEDIIKGISRHGKFVEMSDEKMFKVDSNRGFNVLCFTDSSNVPEYLMRGEGSYCVLPNGTEEENQMLEILIDCLAEAKKYIIARKVYNNNGIPKFVVLVPKPDYNPKCLLLSELPCSDDVKVDYNEKDAKQSSIYENIVENESVYKFLDSMRTDPSLNPLSIPLMQDPNNLRIINKAADKYLDQHLRLEDVDMDYVSTSKAGYDCELIELWRTREDNEKKVEEVMKQGDDFSDDEFDF